jgi:hypothetical protein
VLIHRSLRGHRLRIAPSINNCGIIHRDGHDQDEGHEEEDREDDEFFDLSHLGVPEAARTVGA